MAITTSGRDTNIGSTINNNDGIYFDQYSKKLEAKEKEIRDLAKVIKIDSVQLV
ncbi:MAG: hypothetical protein P8176_14685 [Gammaproteobacteria bacterium]